MIEFAFERKVVIVPERLRPQTFQQEDQQDVRSFHCSTSGFLDQTVYSYFTRFLERLDVGRFVLQPQVMGCPVQP